MSTTIPDPQQRYDALAHANEIRTHRAQLKRDLKAGLVPAPELIEMPYQLVNTMKVIDVLVAMPKFGRIKAATMLRRANVSPSKTLGGLSERQRHELLAMLRVYPARLAA